jgi:F-type H+-transporting ATPase subunit b
MGNMLAVVPLAAPELAARLQQAALIDLDITIVTQGIFFFLLVLVLPRLIFRPMLERIEQREFRTEGARADARAMRHAADEEAALFDQAMTAEKRKALAERAEVRQSTQRKAEELVATARTQTAARIDQGLTRQRAEAVRHREVLSQDAALIARQVADKIAEG